MQTAAEDVLPTGFQVIETLRSGASTTVHRAVRNADGARVVIKVLRRNRVEHKEVARLRHEYEIASRLGGGNVVRALALDEQRGHPAIVFEDIGGTSLDVHCKQRPLSMDQLLAVAIGVVRGLDRIHAGHVVHRDVNPTNIVYNPNDGAVQIIDFGIASAVAGERAPDADDVLPEGSLPYIAPEQTGRMSRAADYRSDFYSFGATLYELLTRRPMFDVAEPAEWLHCHIAKRPTPPAEIDPSIPPALSDMVMKLIAKSPEERYQSAAGIEADLHSCLQRWQAGGRIERFPLGSHDARGTLQAPQRLFGREEAIAQLTAGFQRACAGGVDMALVAGPPGAGKTALVREFQRTVAGGNGFFISGKCDRLHRNVPVHALTGALGELVRQLVTEPEEELVRWRAKLRDALGANGQLIVDVIPELEIVIGPQPAVPVLAARESERRFHRVFQDFIATFATEEHPLVLFVDNLQWSDSATNKLLERLIRDEATGYLQIIVAYRDDDVAGIKRLARGVQRLRDDGLPVRDVIVGPLNRDHIEQWLAGSLDTDARAVEPLAALVEQKTAGSPFFVDEFLRHLGDQGLIAYDRDCRAWVWDLEGIKAQRITDNVVELMTGRLARLSEPTRRLVELAACIGGRFPLDLLAMVAERPVAAVVEDLHEAVSDGLVVPLSEGFRSRGEGAKADDQTEFAFTHDRVQQGAYAQLDRGRRLAVHLSIARLMSTELSPAQYQARLFDIANHFNLGREGLTDAGERLDVCRLNLEAGSRAKATNAYVSAESYFSEAMALLPEDAWESCYELTLELYGEATEAAYLNGDYERMDALLEHALPRTRTLLDRVRLHDVQIIAFTARGRMIEAIRLGLRLLSELGIEFPEEPTQEHVKSALGALLARMNDVSMDEIRVLPEMTDPYQRAARKIVQRLGGPAYLLRPRLFSLLVFDSIERSMTYGHCTDALTAYASIGVILGAVLGRHQDAARFGELALELVERLQARHMRARVLHVHTAFVRHWLEPVQSTLEPLREVHRLGIETGDFEFATHGANIYAYTALACGLPLQRYAEDMVYFRQSIARLRQGPLIHYTQAAHQVALNLMGRDDGPDPSRLVGASYDIDRMLPVHEQAGDRPMVLAAHYYAFHLAYHFGNYHEAVTHTELARRHLGHSLGAYLSVVTLFYDSLSRLAVCSGATAQQRRRLLRQVAKNQHQLRGWAALNPHNCADKAALVEAERNRLRGRTLKAMALYDEVIAAARASGFVQEEAIANELAGAMHLEAGRLTVAEAYLQKAYEATARWGASAKLEELKRRYPEVANAAASGDQTVSTRQGRTSTGPLADMDTGALIKALKAIADEPVHSRMIDAIIRTAVEFAGAQQGVLILRDSRGGLCVEAEASVDGGDPLILQSVPVEQSTGVCLAVVNYVARTQASLVVHDAQQAHDDLPSLHQDPYVRANGVRSILCLPIVAATSGRPELIGILYLENNRVSNCFTEERFGTLEIICMSAAGRLELSRKAAVDGLTQLFNHDYFENMLHQELAVSSRQKRHVSLILADIDHFKRFNDTWGHQLGDQVLREVARTIKAGCRDADIAARYGGEEIAIILPDCDLQAAAVVAERLRRAVAETAIEHAGQSLAVTLSLGVASASAGQTPEALVGEADAALYRAKDRGRNRISTG